MSLLSASLAATGLPTLTTAAEFSATSRVVESPSSKVGLLLASLMVIVTVMVSSVLVSAFPAEFLLSRTVTVTV